MNRTATLQAAVVAVLVGVMLILLGGGGAASSEPQHLTTYRPATEQERRQRDVERLQEEMDRLWWEWHTPTPTLDR